jgi:hypothetical protein
VGRRSPSHLCHGLWVMFAPLVLDVTPERAAAGLSVKRRNAQLLVTMPKSEGLIFLEHT